MCVETLKNGSVSGYQKVVLTLNGKDGYRVTTAKRVAVGGVGLAFVILGHKLLADAFTANKN